MNRTPNWIVPLILIFAVMWGATVLWAAISPWISSSWFDYAASISGAVCILFGNTVLLLLVSAWIYAKQGKSLILVVACAFALVGVASALIGHYNRAMAPIARFDIGQFFEAAGQTIADPKNVIPLLLLSSTRFKGNLDWLRIAVIPLIVLNVAANLGVYASWYFRNGGIVTDLAAVSSVMVLIISLWAAWCLAFYQSAAPNRPPIDAQRTISLTCPRCQSPLQIPSGHADCPHCRLQITISLNEGACSTCHYPLRGLTSDKCPECGTSIVPQANPKIAAAYISKDDPPMPSPLSKT